MHKVKSESESEVVPDSQQPHGLQPTRLLRPWDFPGKSTGVEEVPIITLGLPKIKDGI